ncbi:MAG: exodeoxyribonuclease VII large subunit [Patescibacteria group bacterium]|nr:exodeoxyribonuclease VII large subunit [Patescibacteria group bacterium]
MPENFSLFDNSEVLEKLREWRKRRAISDGVEPYMVFQNSTLEATVETHPSTEEELLEIKGWGKSKVSKYGRDVLEIISGGKNDEQRGSRTEPIKEKEGPVPSLAAFAYELRQAKSKEFAVNELILAINYLLRALKTVRVKGEIGEISKRQGYAFITLKDTSREHADSAIQCFVGGSVLEYYSHLIETGAEVILVGHPDVYKTGSLRLIVQSIEPVGEGAWLKALAALKQKLEAKGYFDPARKRPIPELAMSIGLITSEAGAAVTDFRKNLGNYGFKVFLYDVRVEGEYAESSITSAIRWMNKNKPDLDVLVLIRGGGGAENLKVFNSEKIVEEIVASRTPVITGIGHEKDESMADYAADLKLSTPTAVALFLTGGRENLLDKITGNGEKIGVSLENAIREAKTKLGQKENNLFESLKHCLSLSVLKINRLSSEMHRGLERIFNGFAELQKRFTDSFYSYEKRVLVFASHVNSLTERCGNMTGVMLSAKRSAVDVMEASLSTLNPDSVLERGYSLAYGALGKVVKNAEELKIGDTLNVRFSKGKAETKVTKTDK